MGETKESKKAKKGKHKQKASIGDLVFRVLIIVAIFFIVVITYSFYIRDMIEELKPNTNAIGTQIQNYR